MEMFFTSIVAIGLVCLVGYIVYMMGYHTGHANGVRSELREFYDTQKSDKDSPGA